MEDDREELPLPQTLDERPIYIPDVLLEDVVEIPHRLVEMDAEDEVERVQLVALREAEASRQFARHLRANAIELGLDVEGDMLMLEMQEIDQIPHGAHRRDRLIVLERQHRSQQSATGHVGQIRGTGEQIGGFLCSEPPGNDLAAQCPRDREPLPLGKIRES